MNLKTMIVMTASYYEKAITEPILEMYVEDLADLPEAAVIEGYRKYRRNPKNKTFPLPAQIRELVSPVVSDDSAAREAASRINEAVIRFGYGRESEAKDFIGELGWSVVNRYGGWKSLCENLGVEISMGTFIAQARDLARAHIELSKSGELGIGPTLPEPQNYGTENRGLTSGHEILKLINPPKEGA